MRMRAADDSQGRAACVSVDWMLLGQGTAKSVSNGRFKRY